MSARSAYDLWLERNIKQATLVLSATLDAAYQQFTAVQQAIGTQRRNAAGAKFLAAFVEEAKKSGLVARLIERHKVKGRSVAPPA